MQDLAAYLSKRTMVSPKYVDVKAVNDMVLSRIPGDVITCVSNDSFNETDSAGRPIIGH